jgi:D-amino-acid oxidase
MAIYLGYLMERFHAAGGRVDARNISTLAEAAQSGYIVVNCAGIGARWLVPDAGLWPVRGQLVVLENPGIDEFFSEDTGMSPELLHIYRTATRSFSVARPRTAAGT